MKIVAPLLVAAALAAPAAAQDYRVDVFGGFSPDSSLNWNNSAFDTTYNGFYGISVDRLDFAMPGLDVGLEYNYMSFEYSTSAPNSISANSVFITAEYGTEVTTGLDLFATGALGASQVEYVNTAPYTNQDIVGSGYLGLGARYHFDTFSTFIEFRHQGAIGEALVGGAAANLGAEIYGNVLLLGAGFSF